MESNKENNRQEENKFSYTYSAKEQEEIRHIREKYMPSDETEDKMERVRRLDASVTKKSQCVAITLGIIGTLILGSGMSLFMTDISQALGLSENIAMVIGIIVGIVGGVMVSLAYPIYNFMIKKMRRKIAPQIIRLIDELQK